jgi:hypothetical protein
MKTRNSFNLWSDGERRRYFLIPADATPASGNLTVYAVAGSVETGHEASVDRLWAEPFEITEDHAHRWARDELGATLEELGRGLDSKLAEWRHELEDFKRRPVSDAGVTPETGPAVLDLLRELPRVIGQSFSGDERRVEAARRTMADLQQRLKDAGIDLDDRFTNFPDRLADLRKDYKEQRATKKSNSDGTTSDQR